MALIGSWVQRSSCRSFNRLGLGAGDDRVHALSRFAHGRARSAPNILLWRLRLLGCPSGDGLYRNTVAGTRRRFVPFGHRRGLRYAGPDRSYAAVFNDATTLHLLLDHLHGHECRLPDRGANFRLYPAVIRRTWSHNSLWIRDQRLPLAVSGKPRFRATASSDDLFSAPGS